MPIICIEIHIIKKFGFSIVEGSTNKGGEASLRSMLEILGAGGYVGITPDGPRGPGMRVSAGIVRLARMADIPIIPVSFGARKGWVLGTWDRFLLPWPFSGGVILWGKPIKVPKNSDAEELEEKRLELEHDLNSLLSEADNMTGRETLNA